MNWPGSIVQPVQKNLEKIIKAGKQKKSLKSYMGEAFEEHLTGGKLFVYMSATAHKKLLKMIIIFLKSDFFSSKKVVTNRLKLNPQSQSPVF